MPPISEQLLFLMVLAIPIAAVVWTVTHEEIFREFRDWCTETSRVCSGLVKRKILYIFTCEFCFSFYVSLMLVAITRYQLLYAGWRGYLIAVFSLVWVANIYISLFGRLRLDIKHERVEIAQKERQKN